MASLVDYLVTETFLTYKKNNMKKKDLQNQKVNKLVSENETLFRERMKFVKSIDKKIDSNLKKIQKLIQKTK
jgi:hypothetical protein